MRASLSAAALCVAGLAMLVAGSVPAQTPTALTKRTARSKYTLGRVSSAQELPDGRVVVSDSKEQVFRLVDFAKGDVGLLGKPGDDSTSYRTATLVFALPGDSLGLYDPAGRKVLHLSPLGTVASYVALPPIAAGRRVGTLLGADKNGRLYFTLPEQSDTGTTAVAGVARVTRVNVDNATDEPLLTFRTRRADQVNITGIMPYFYRDAIALRPDGLFARVVADSYDVIWSRDGKETGRTGPLQYTPIAIASAEQQAIKDSVAESVHGMFGSGAGNTRTMTSGAGLPPGVTVSSSGGGSVARTSVSTSGGSSGGVPVVTSTGPGGGVSQQYIAKNPDGSLTAAPTDMASMMNNLANQPLGKFPDFKPPIVSSGVAARFDNDGNLWVARERVHGDAVPHYDVIAEGKGVIARIDLPAGTRMVGFGKGTVYVARAENGSDWLERYTMPMI